MGTDQYIDFAISHLLENLIGFGSTLGPAQMFDPHRELLKPITEGTIVLQCQNSGRHQNCHLLRIIHRLKRRTNRHLGFTKAHITANQPVHRRTSLHIGLHRLRRRLLIRRILIDKRCLQLILQIAVRRESKPFARFAPCIQRDQLAGNILDRLLRILLHALPCPRSQLVDLGRLAILILVFADAVQSMDVDQQHIVVTIDQLDRLVYLSVLNRTGQPAETAHTVVDMHHVIPHLQFVQLLNGQTLTAINLTPDLITVVPIKQLMVSIATIARNMINKTAVQRHIDRFKRNVTFANRIEDVAQPFDLRLIFSQQAGLIPLTAVNADIIGQQLKFLVELRLRGCMECNRMICRPLFEIIPQQHHCLPLRIGQESLTTGNQRIDLFGIFQLAEQFGTYFLEPLQSVFRIRKPIGRRSHKSRERDALPS